MTIYYYYWADSVKSWQNITQGWIKIMGESCDIVIGVSVELNNFQIEFSKQYLRSISVSAEDVSMQETEWEYLQIPVQTLVSSTHSRYGWIQYWQGPENKAEPPSYITYLCTTLSSNTKIRQSLIIKKFYSSLSQSYLLQLHLSSQLNGYFVFKQ